MKKIVVAAALAAALGACKKSEKSEESPKPQAKIDAKAPAPVVDATPAKPAPDAAPAAQSGKINPFFFRAEKDGKAIHLLGTMHMGVAPEELPDYVYAELDKAKTFAMETDLTDMSVLEQMRLPDGKTLDQLIGADYWKKFEDAVGAAMAQGMKGFKPAAAASLLELQGLPMTMPMDMVLLNRAKEHQAKIVYLEEASLQEKVLEKWLDAQALKEMLDELDTSKDKQKEMLDAYKAGDADKVAALTADKSSWKRSEAEFDAMMKDILFDRNASWIAALETMIGEGEGFVAVGAAHLIGPGSVVELLQKKGYSVTRVGS